jgi:hypothetical protein
MIPWHYREDNKANPTNTSKRTMFLQEFASSEENSALYKEFGTKRTFLLTIHSSFGIAMGNAIQAGCLGLNSSRVKIFLFSIVSRLTHEAHPASYLIGNEGCSPRGKAVTV